jgi:uncharacterized membrane protein
VHAACRLLPDDPWVLRLPAVLAGVLVAPACYLVGQALYNSTSGLLAGCLAATSPILIDYSVNARGYTMICLFVLLSILIGDLLVRRSNLAGWSVLALLSAIGVWTVPIMIYPLLGLAVWMAVSWRMRQTSWRSNPHFLRALVTWAVVVVVLSVVLYSPIFVVSGARAMADAAFVHGTWGGYWAAMSRRCSEAYSLLLGTMPAVVQLALAAGVICHFLSPRIRRSHAVWLAPIYGLCFFAPVTLQRAAPPVRAWLFLLPLGFLVAASGAAALIGSIGRQRLRRIVLGVLLAACGPWLFLRAIDSEAVKHSRETGTLRDAESIVLFLKSPLQPEDYVVSSCPSTAPLIYYVRRHGLPLRHFESTGSPTSPHRRLVVVVNRTHKQRLGDVLDEYGLRRWFDPATARRIKEYDTATLFQLETPPTDRRRP